MILFPISSDIKPERKKSVNKIKKTLVAAISCLMPLLLLMSCAENKLIARQNGLYDEKNKIYYVYAPLNAEAVDYGDEICFKDAHNYTYRALYDLNGNECDTDKLIYDSESRTLLYNSEFGFPELSEFEPNRATFYIEENSAVILTSDDNPISVAELARTIENPSIQYDALPAAETYRLKLYSEKYPYFTYYFIYIEYSKDKLVDDKVATLDGYSFRKGVPHTETVNEDGSVTVTYNYGKYFLYDRNSGLCHMAQYVHDKYNAD